MPFVAFVLLSIKMTAHQGWASLRLCASACVRVVGVALPRAPCPLPSLACCLTENLCNFRY